MESAELRVNEGVRELNKINSKQMFRNVCYHKVRRKFWKLRDLKL